MAEAEIKGEIKRYERAVWADDPCANLIEDLNSLERAIVDMCDIDTVHAIYERRRMIRKR